MKAQVLLHGPLGTHRRAKVLQEALGAVASESLPAGGAIVLAFAEGFQSSDKADQLRLVEWTRAPGHLLLLLPPFAKPACTVPVPWSVERLETPPRGGEEIAKVLAPEVAYRLTGSLKAAPMAGASWTDLSLCVGTYRLHPAAGLFAVTCLPLWSLSVLDATPLLESWMTKLLDLAGKVQAPQAVTVAPLRPDHFGFLVFLLSKAFADKEAALAGLQSSPIFRFSPETGRSLLDDLNERKLIIGAAPTPEAQDLIMQSPYAPYLTALREVSR